MGGILTMRALAIDRNREDLSILSSVLWAYGFSVDKATDSHEAVTLANSNMYDLVIVDMDMEMPENFRAFYVNLLVRFPQLAGKVILMAEKLECECEDFLSETSCPLVRKPFLTLDLLKVVDDVVEAVA
jgi:CheY-like chemotaxis protein